MEQKTFNIGVFIDQEVILAWLGDLRLTIPHYIETQGLDVLKTLTITQEDLVNMLLHKLNTTTKTQTTYFIKE